MSSRRFPGHECARNKPRTFGERRLCSCGGKLLFRQASFVEFQHIWENWWAWVRGELVSPGGRSPKGRQKTRPVKAPQLPNKPRPLRLLLNRTVRAHLSLNEPRTACPKLKKPCRSWPLDQRNLFREPRRRNRRRRNRLRSQKVQAERLR